MLADSTNKPRIDAKRKNTVKPKPKRQSRAKRKSHTTRKSEAANITKCDKDFLNPPLKCDFLSCHNAFTANFDQ